jgi:serine/threonine protein kinase
MTAVDASGLTEALADERLLEPEQFEEFVNSMLPVCQDVVILAKELAYRGWLTPYQVEQILAGQTNSLLMGSYVLLEPLGEGAMGKVFRARNWKLDRIVAIKVIRDAQSRQPAVIARFRREIRALGRIRHPNIVLAVDAEIKRGFIFYAMEYVEGCDLGRYVRQHGPLSIYDACNFVAQAADALQHAYEIGLIHRDIKPSNLLLTEPDHTVKLLDLGLTRCEVPVNDSVFVQMTHAGALIGTPDFMSPEQVKDSRSADVRSDLYSLGCTFYYLLTGMAPFERIESVVDKLYAQCESEPVPVEQIRPDLPSEIAAVVRKLLSKRRRDRFQTPVELVTHLQSLFVDNYQPIRDTILDAPFVTLVDAPFFQPIDREPPPTEVLSTSELGLIVLSDETDEDPPSRRFGASLLIPAQIIVAALIATLTLVLLWQWGIGPGALRGDSHRGRGEQITEGDAPAKEEGGGSADAPDLDNSQEQRAPNDPRL